MRVLSSKCREREREKMGRRREVEQGNEKRINSNDRKKT